MKMLLATTAAFMVIASVTPAPAARTSVLYAWGRKPDSGWYAVGSLLRTRSGALFVVTNGDCSAGKGGVFELRQSSGRWRMRDVYCFSGGTDGAAPWGGVIADSTGSLYGTTANGGKYGQGAVYQLTRNNGSWLESVIYSFKESEPFNPVGDLVMDSSGALYGVAQNGGDSLCGGVFKLKKAKALWVESVLATFDGNTGCLPYAGLHMDSSGTLYGTTMGGGTTGGGVVFALAGTNLTVLHDFSTTDGANPEGALVEDSSGALYGTTWAGGANGVGVVFALAKSGGKWTETVLHSFSGSDGANPRVGLTPDAPGVFYGTTWLGGRSDEGVVFKLVGQDSLWTESVLHSFGTDGIAPSTPVTDDGSGRTLRRDL